MKSKFKEIKFSNVAGCVCVIYNPTTNSILLTKRKDVPIWTFPGGTREENENPIKCVCREIEEEVGLSIVSPLLFAKYKLKNGAQKNLYFTTYAKGNIKIDPNEVSDYRWFSITRLPKYVGLYNAKTVQDFIKYLVTKETVTREQRVYLKKELLTIFLSNPLNFLVLIVKYLINRLTKKTFKL